MGEVYKALDPRLNRIVAIKRLKGQHSARFEQEAHAIAALNHTNICQIYDIGPDPPVGGSGCVPPSQGWWSLDFSAACAIGGTLRRITESAFGGTIMRTLIPLGVVLAALPLTAADDNSKAVFAKHWQTSKEFTLAVAQAMPAESYDFKPNPAEMSFGELMIHIADQNSQDCARAAKTKPLAKPPGTDKETAVQFLTKAFDTCAREFNALTSEQLDSVLFQLRGQPVTTWEQFWFTFTHTAHHRGQAEVYLRLKDIKPPDYTF